MAEPQAMRCEDHILEWHPEVTSWLCRAINGDIVFYRDHVK
jgi:hypothetical protein